MYFNPLTVIVCKRLPWKEDYVKSSLRDEVMLSDDSK